MGLPLGTILGTAVLLATLILCRYCGRSRSRNRLDRSQNHHHQHHSRQHQARPTLNLVADPPSGDQNQVVYVVRITREDPGEDPGEGRTSQPAPGCSNSGYSSSPPPAYATLSPLSVTGAGLLPSTGLLPSAQPAPPAQPARSDSDSDSALDSPPGAAPPYSKRTLPSYSACMMESHPPAPPYSE